MGHSEDSSDDQEPVSRRRKAAHADSDARGAAGARAKILGWLGTGSRQTERKKPSLRKAQEPPRERKTVKATARRVTARSAQATVGAALKAAVAKNAKVDDDSSPPPLRKRSEAVNALKFGSEVPARRARGTRITTARVVKRRAQPAPVPQDNASSDQDDASSCTRCSERSSSSSPVRVQRPAPAAAKRPRATGAAALSAPVAAAARSSQPSAAKSAALAMTVRPAPPVSASVAPAPVEQPLPGIPPDAESSFQAAILDRLRALCGEHEDAKVLAEYIVVMVAGSKGKEEMSHELKPFFSDQAQAESFVEWVEECKWTFLTGSPSPTKPRAGSPAGAAAASSSKSAARAAAPDPSAGLHSPPAHAASSSSARPRPAAGTEPNGSAKQRGPHVAVTSKIVLQPNPDFAPGPVSEAVSPAARASVTSPTAASKAQSVSKNELLENMTRQLQLILTKLSDKTLTDDVRERYQALAQSIQQQMSKLTRPAAPRRR